jgi:phosphoglycolate phosphatase-like HAD superfamily hydrolase
MVPAITRRVALTALLLSAVGQTAAFAQSTAADPLPSWNDGPAKRANVSFVERVTRGGSPNYIEPAERIAVFDNDGTLWAEQPIYFQFAFAIDRVKAQAADNPQWRETEPFKSAIAGDLGAVAATGIKGLTQILAATHAGLTTDAFAATAHEWLTTARHPRFRRLYTDLVYQPQLELLGYLRANGFKTFIVSGGGVEFIRAFAERSYGIPPEQVVGSSGLVKFAIGPDGKPALLKEPGVEFVDDGPGKPVGINRFIGRRPILAFGNSDGDLEMLQWTAAGSGPSLMLLVHHDDAEREWAYDRQSPIGRLDKALDEATAKGWTVVSMKRDWRKIFAFEP